MALIMDDLVFQSYETTHLLKKNSIIVKSYYLKINRDHTTMLAYWNIRPFVPSEKLLRHPRDNSHRRIYYFNLMLFYFHKISYECLTELLNYTKQQSNTTKTILFNTIDVANFNHFLII